MNPLSDKTLDRVGSYARDSIADSVRMRKAKAFSEQLDETLNATLIRWIVELNYPGCSIPRLRRNFEDLEQKEDPVKVVQILTQLQAIGYGVSDLDWVRDKLEIPSLEKVAMPDLSAPDMAESDGEVEDLGRIVQGEKAISQLVARNSLSAAENLDFTEFDENGDLKDQTVRDKVSKLIADRFNQGGIDEVGWERIATGISSVDSESSRINLDGYTSPGDIIFTTKRLLDELRAIPRVIPEDRDMLRRELVIFENKALVGEKFTPEDINNLVKVYTLSYRLNRSAVHGECVVLDPDKTGYWSFFAPYFM